MPSKANLQFVKKNYQIAYSILLILFIPAAIIVNTIFFINTTKKNIDQVLYDKTIAVGEVIDAMLAGDLSNQTYIQTRLKAIAQKNSAITKLDILKKENEEFTVLASLNKEIVGKKSKETSLLIAWQQKQPVAYLAQDTTNDNKERFWVITMPIHNEQNEQQGLLSMRVSLKIMDRLTNDLLIRSYSVLAITILIIVLLLANNTRFFEYATLYRKLKEVDVMKDEFISVASHELRTPVTAIRGFVSLVLEGSFGEINKDIRESLEMAYNSTVRLNTLVEDLLNVSRIEQGRFKIEQKPQDITPLIIDTIKELSVQAKEKNLTLAYKPHKDALPFINIDGDRFKQVLINLIGNAIKYTKQGSIDVITEEKNNGKSLEILIKDTGIGMTAEERERLFEKFYRVQNTDTREISGTGLGLWITKQIVEHMRGKIVVDSIKTIGTQITLTFPTVTL